ncbi:MAG: DUF6242 domain-containing protein [Phocaeicola sp.]
MEKKLSIFATSSNKSLFVQMKIKFLTVVTLLVTTLLASSCLGSDSYNSDYSSDASIVAFSINGKIVTSYPGTTASGADTTYTVTVLGSDYPFAVDQLQRQIYPVDSLPVGTDVSRVVVSITGDTSYLLMEREGRPDTLWVTTDSLNFEKPIRFKVVSNSGKTGNPYTVKMNVHQQDPDSMVWVSMDSKIENENFTKQKAVAFNDRIYLFADDAGQVQVTSTSITDGIDWTGPRPVDLEELVDYASVTVWNGKLYLLAGNKLYSSENALGWTEVAGAPELRMLIANITSDATEKLVGINLENHFAEADKSDESFNWTDTQKKVSDRFPKKNLSYASYPLASNPAIDRMVVMGDNEITTDSIASVWSKLTSEDSWVETTPIAGKTYCPRMENIAMIHYNKQLYAFGGSAKRADTTFVAMGQFFVSANHGVNWESVDSKARFPKEFSELYTNAGGNYSYVVDKNNYLWILFANSKTVWRGKINKLGFGQ